MIKELSKLLDLFPGPDNQTRCFTHVLNLIAKSIIRQFDIPKAQQHRALDESLEELQALAIDIDLEEKATRDGVETGSDENDDDNTDGVTIAPITLLVTRFTLIITITLVASVSYPSRTAEHSYYSAVLFLLSNRCTTQH
jgi:hypothetical protein